jgi:hypothetical protein
MMWRELTFFMANDIGQKMLWKNGTTVLREMLASLGLTSFNCSRFWRKTQGNKIVKIRGQFYNPPQKRRKNYTEMDWRIDTKLLTLCLWSSVFNSIQFNSIFIWIHEVQETHWLQNSVMNTLVLATYRDSKNKQFNTVMVDVITVLVTWLIVLTYSWHSVSHLCGNNSRLRHNVWTIFTPYRTSNG